MSKRKVRNVLAIILFGGCYPVILIAGVRRIEWLFLSSLLTAFIIYTVISFCFPDDQQDRKTFNDSVHKMD